MAFTQLNTIMLTTEGKVYTWGAVTPCLGRDFYQVRGSEEDYSETTLRTKMLGSAGLVDEIDNNFQANE